MYRPRQRHSLGEAERQVGGDPEARPRGVVLGRVLVIDPERGVLEPAHCRRSAPRTARPGVASGVRSVYSVTEIPFLWRWSARCNPASRSSLRGRAPQRHRRHLLRHRHERNARLAAVRRRCVNVRMLRSELVPIIILASIGVVISKLVIGFGLWYVGGILGLGLPLVWALVFGMISPRSRSRPFRPQEREGAATLVDRRRVAFQRRRRTYPFTVLLAVAMATSGCSLDEHGAFVNTNGGMSARGRQAVLDRGLPRQPSRRAPSPDCAWISG